MLFMLISLEVNMVPSRCLSKTFVELINHFIFSSHTVLPRMVGVVSISDDFGGDKWTSKMASSVQFTKHLKIGRCSDMHCGNGNHNEEEV